MDDFPGIREYMRTRRTPQEADAEPDVLAEIAFQLRLANLLAYAGTYPFKQPVIREEIEKGLGI